MGSRGDSSKPTTSLGNKSLQGLHWIVQYPCHTLFPSEVVWFEESVRAPQGLRRLVEALGAAVDGYSREDRKSVV